MVPARIFCVKVLRSGCLRYDLVARRLQKKCGAREAASPRRVIDRLNFVTRSGNIDPDLLAASVKQGDGYQDAPFYIISIKIADLVDSACGWNRIAVVPQSRDMTAERFQGAARRLVHAVASRCKAGQVGKKNAEPAFPVGFKGGDVACHKLTPFERHTPSFIDPRRPENRLDGFRRQILARMGNGDFSRSRGVLEVLVRSFLTVLDPAGIRELPDDLATVHPAIRSILCVNIYTLSELSSRLLEHRRDDPVR